MAELNIQQRLGVSNRLPTRFIILTLALAAAAAAKDAACLCMHRNHGVGATRSA
jgi:hypothetical protein